MMSVTNGGAKELLPLGETTVIEHILEVAFSVCDHAVVVWDIKKGDLPDGIVWVPQMPQRGLAPAIASGITSDDTNLIFLPDAVFLPFDPVTKLAALGEGDIAIALSKVSDEDMSRYGICEVDEHGWVTRMLEKPAIGDTDSRWAIMGRYRLSGASAELLVQSVTTSSFDGKEIDLSQFFSLAMSSGLRIAGCFLDEEYVRFDCGDPNGYLDAAEAFDE
jgi:UTP--glucose-1-phosphate uridylyltransferase